MMQQLRVKLEERFKKSMRLEEVIRESLQELRL